jgi:hypothetical protein
MGTFLSSYTLCLAGKRGKSAQNSVPLSKLSLLLCLVHVELASLCRDPFFVWLMHLMSLLRTTTFNAFAPIAARYKDHFAEPVTADAVAAAAADSGGRLIRFSSSAGRTWNSLKIALAPALLQPTVENLAMASCEILSIMLVACCFRCLSGGGGGGGTKSKATGFNC